MTLPNNSALPPAANPPQHVQADPRQLFKSTGAMSPLDFVKQNTEKLTQEKIEQGVSSYLTQPQAPVEPQVEQAVIPEAPVESFVEVPGEVVAQPDVAEIPEEGEGVELKDNFKKVKTFFKAEKEEHKKTKEQLAARDAELEDYKKGVKLPDTVMEQEAELAKLRQIQKTVDLKSSPEYHEAFVEPLTQVTAKQDEILKQYEIPKAELEKAKSQGVKALNQFLSENFDPAAIVELKGLFDTEKKLVTGMNEAHANADTAYAKLIDQSKQARATRMKGEREVIKSVINESWGKTLEEIKQQGQFVELIHRPKDTQYNETIVNPTIRAAAAETSKLMAMLVEDGLTRVRPEVAQFISKMSLLAHSSAINAVTRERAMGYANELKKNTTRTNQRVRPTMGGSQIPTAAAPAEQRPRLTPESFARAATGLLNPANRAK